MTRMSSSRGFLYSAPPGEDEQTDHDEPADD